MEDFCLLRLNNVKIISEVEQTSNYSIHHAEVAETPCFVKAMRQTGVTGGDAAEDTTELRSRLHRECVLLNRLRHQSIVPFMGIHYDRDPANLALVTGSTYMDLETCLRTYPTMPLSVRISVLLDVLRGVLYLHIQDPSIILCNLTSKSIHVTSDMKGTLTDLNEAIAVGGKVPKTLPAYCQAPESKGHPPRLQRRTDIFHLGVLALRLFSTGREESGSVAQPSESELLQREGSLLVLISSFLHESPELRPRANNACKRLKEIAAKHPKEFSDVLQLYSEQCKMVQCMALIGSAEADSAELLLRCQTLEQEKSQLATAVTALREEVAALQGQLSQSESTAQMEHKRRSHLKFFTLTIGSRAARKKDALKALKPQTTARGQSAAYLADGFIPRKVAGTLPDAQSVKRSQKRPCTEISIRPLPSTPDDLMRKHRVSAPPEAYSSPSDKDGKVSPRSSDYEDVDDASLEYPEEAATQEKDTPQRQDPTQRNDVIPKQNLTEGHEVTEVDGQAGCAALEECNVDKSSKLNVEGDVKDNLSQNSYEAIEYQTEDELENTSVHKDESESDTKKGIANATMAEGKSEDDNIPVPDCNEGTIYEGAFYEVPVEPPLNGYPWFHSNIDVVAAEEILSAQKKDGTYLMRESTSIPGQYTLSLYYDRMLSHLRISLHNGYYTLDNHKVFNSIVELVKYYQCHNIGIGKCSQACLKYTCSSISNSVAI